MADYICFMTKTQYAFRNTFFGIAGKMVTILCSFAARTCFIYVLGNELLGINGLYTEILAVLSFAELGFGTALTFCFYKPIVNNDVQTITKLLNFYRRVYRIIALVVVTAGLIVLPLLEFIVKGAESVSLWDLKLYFIIFLANTIIGYAFTYKISYVNALQKNYVISNFETIANICVSAAQIVLILTTKNFLAYLLSQTVVLALSRIVLAIYLNKRYPILKLNNPAELSAEEKKPIFKEVGGLAIHQFSSVAIHSTDNIIISALSGMGVAAVGMISNYNLIINSVLAFVVIIFTSVTAGFGHLAASGDSNNFRRVFEIANFINFWVYGFCSIAFFVLVPPFISLWIGPANVIDTLTFLLIVSNVYLQGQSTIYNNARIAKGNFAKDRWISFTQAMLNLVVSVFGALYLGVFGVFIGTIVSRLFFVVARPIAVHRFAFDESPKKYFSRFALYFGVTLVAGTATYFASYYFISHVSVWSFVVACFVVTIVPNLIWFLLFFKTRVFRETLQRGVTFFKRICHRKKA